MIEASQIRAARALLDWSTKDLAKATGLTVNGLNKIERGYVSAQTSSLQSIQDALEEAGVEFLPNQGLRMRDRQIVTHTGPEACRKLLQDVLDTLGDGESLYIAHVRVRGAVAAIGEEFLMDQIAKRRAKKIKQHVFVAEDDDLIPPFDTYRVMPEQYFGASALYIYGTKLAFAVWQDPQKSVIINDERLADGVRKLFQFAWDRTEMPKLKGRA